MANKQSSSVLYKLTGRYVNGVDVVGYKLIDINGYYINARKEDVERLAAENAIENCIAVRYGDKVYMKGVGIRLSELPIIDYKQNINNNSNTMKLQAKLTDGSTIIGYMVTDDKGNKYKLSKDKVWQLSRNGHIIGVKAYLKGGKKILKCDNQNIMNISLISIT